jgi:chromosome segregation ATPase
MLDVAKQITLPLSISEKENSASPEKLLKLFVEKDSEILSLRKTVEELNSEIKEWKEKSAWQVVQIIAFETENSKLKKELEVAQKELREAQESSDYLKDKSDYLKDKIEELEIENEFFNEEINLLLLEDNDMMVNDEENDSDLYEVFGFTT